jgi:hypothetical protein
MRLKVNIFSWIVFLMLIHHMTEAKKIRHEQYSRAAHKTIVAMKRDMPVKWKEI